MSRFYGVPKGWKIAAIVLLGILIASIVAIAIFAGVKSVHEDIGYFEALKNLFTGFSKAPETIEETETFINLL